MAYRDRANYWANRYGIDPALFSSVIQQESSWDPHARSHAGAYGLTQVMPATARDPGFGVAPLTNPEDTEEQLRFGADYLSKMLSRYDGDQARALAAYNAGPGRADKWQSGDLSALPDETQGYIQSIMGSLRNRPQAAGPTESAALEAAAEESTPELPTDLMGLISRVGQGILPPAEDDDEAEKRRRPTMKQAILGSVLQGLGNYWS